MYAEIPENFNFASHRADLPPQKVKDFLVEITGLHDQVTPVSGKDIQFENVFDFENFINPYKTFTRVSEFETLLDSYLLNVPTVRESLWLNSVV